MSKQRVYVTAIEIESCVGSQVEQFWTNVANGRSGIRPISLFDASDLPCKVAGEVEFDPQQYMSSTLIRRTTRCQQLIYACAARLLANAPDLTNVDNTALVLGTGAAAQPYLEPPVRQLVEGGWRALDRLTLLRALPNMAAGLIAQTWRLRGPVSTISTACASSTDAIGTAFHLVQSGRCGSALAGGVEAWITLLSLGNFCAMNALSTRGENDATTASRPFSRDRDGMVPAEGAGIMLLETLESAQKHRRSPLAEIVGYGSSCDGYHLTAPDPEARGAARAMSMALADGDLMPCNIDHINLHGTSTPLNDVAETRAVKLTFGEHAKEMPLTASKSIFGHASGAAGVLEATVTIMAMRNAYVPPTINLNEADERCDLDFTPLKGRRWDIDKALSVNFGFGGQNAALAFAQYRP
jgi:3-oxoacyl-[acyl-carrier-protein] synthase II